MRGGSPILQEKMGEVRKLGEEGGGSGGGD